VLLCRERAYFWAYLALFKARGKDRLTVNLNLAEHSMTPNGEIRAGFSDKAREITFKDLPSTLEAIRTEARAAYTA